MSTHSVYLFRNGNTAVFDQNGQQVAAAQESWLLLVAEHLKQQGIDPAECTWELPDGRNARVFQTEDGGYNWSLL